MSSVIIISILIFIFSVVFKICVNKYQELVVYVDTLKKNMNSNLEKISKKLDIIENETDTLSNIVRYIEDDRLTYMNDSISNIIKKLEKIENEADKMKNQIDTTSSDYRKFEEHYYKTVMNSPDILGFWYQFSHMEIKKMISYNLHTRYMLYTQRNCDVLNEIIKSGLNIHEGLNPHDSECPREIYQRVGICDESYTPLFHAAMYYILEGHSKNIIKFFINHGANTNIKTKHNFTPEHIRMLYENGINLIKV